MSMVQIEDLCVRFGDSEVVTNVSFEVPEGQAVALVGPSGCGKTTTLRAIGGLEMPSSGRVKIAGRTVFDAEEGINVPSEVRDVSMVFQSYAIWPHMTVFENVAYGLKVRRVRGKELTRRVDEALSLVGLSNLADRPAPMLSGGQQQRVALARSFVFDPKVLLFDEPLSNLDVKLRTQMRVDLRKLQLRLGITSVYVTHDQEEALSMADQVIVMNQGKVLQRGTPADVYYQPRSRFVADFIGAANEFPGHIASGEGASHDAVVRVNGQKVYCAKSVASTELCSVTIKPVHIRLTATRPDCRNSWKVDVREKYLLGEFFLYHLDWNGMLVRVKTLSDTEIEVDSQVWMTFPEKFTIALSSEGDKT